MRLDDKRWPVNGDEAGNERSAHAAKRVLVIDDSDDSRELLRTFLERSGHTVIVATNGIEGLELLLSRKPDVAVVDIRMPGIDGYEVARRVRAVGGFRPRLVALTGYAGADVERRARGAGFDHYFAKPVDFDTLVGLVSTAPSDAAPATCRSREVS